MAEDNETPRREQILLTIVPVIAGVIAGAVSSVVAASATDTSGVLVFAGFAVASVGIGRAATSEKVFGNKDYLFIGFLTFFAWFLTWAVLLTL